MALSPLSSFTPDLQKQKITNGSLFENNEPFSQRAGQWSFYQMLKVSSVFVRDYYTFGDLVTPQCTRD